MKKTLFILIFLLFNLSACSFTISFGQPTSTPTAVPTPDPSVVAATWANSADPIFSTFLDVIKKVGIDSSSSPMNLNDMKVQETTVNVLHSMAKSHSF